MYRYLALLVPLALAACGDDASPVDTAEPVDTDDTDTDVPGDTDDTDVPGDTDDTDLPEGLAIAGDYVDGWGTAHVITDDAWAQTYPGYDADVFHVLDFDNGSGWLIAHNDPANAYFADYYSRFDWLLDGADIYYCQTAFAAASEAEARAVPAADADLGTGCGGFSWTHLTP